MKHERGWEGATPESNTAWRGVRRLTWLPVCRCRVWAFFFFFFFTDSWQLGLIRTDSAWFAPTRLLVSLIRAKLGRFGENQAISADDWNGRNKPKSALNHFGIAKIGFEWGPNIPNLSFLNFILNICCFFCVFFFVLCFLPSSFFVL